LLIIKTIESTSVVKKEQDVSLYDWTQLGNNKNEEQYKEDGIIIRI